MRGEKATERLRGQREKEADWEVKNRPEEWDDTVLTDQSFTTPKIILLFITQTT